MTWPRITFEKKAKVIPETAKCCERVALAEILGARALYRQGTSILHCDYVTFRLDVQEGSWVNARPIEWAVAEGGDCTIEAIAVREAGALIEIGVIDQPLWGVSGDTVRFPLGTVRVGLDSWPL